MVKIIFNSLYIEVKSSIIKSQSHKTNFIINKNQIIKKKTINEIVNVLDENICTDKIKIMNIVIIIIIVISINNI